MKPGAIIVFSCALSCFIYLTSCDRFHRIEGNGIVKTENRLIGMFTAIRSEGSFEVFISCDTVQSVTVEAEENLLPYIETDIHGEELVIKSRDHRNIDNNCPIKIYVRTPSIESIQLSGSGNISCDSLIANYLELQLSGSGNISAMADCNKIKAYISGSGEISLSGSANETDLNIKGSGDIHSYNLKQDSCFADISGSGDLFVYVNKFLDVRISGSGKVHYQGNPVVNTDISGSGMVIHE